MSKAKILIVDDDHPTVMLTAKLLEKQGYEVLTAFDGLEGLAKAREHVPDLIILDIMMPKMDGYQVCQRLQRSPETREIGVLMLTSKGGVEKQSGGQIMAATRIKERLGGYEAGAMDFLTKPIRFSDLLQRVQSLLWVRGIS